MSLDRATQRLSSILIKHFFFLSNFFFLKSHLDEIHTHYICSDCHQSFPSEIALDDHIQRCPEIFENCRLGSYCAEDMVRKSFFQNK